MNGNIAIQLHALQAECENDLEGTLKKLKGMGFNGVEFSSFFGKTPKEIAEALENSGLLLAASHVPIVELLDNFDEVVGYQLELGGERIVIYYGDIHGSESLSLLIDNLNGLSCRLRQHRIELFYHNHEQEFKNYGTNSIALDEIMDKTDLLLEFDAFWAEQAGADISEVMEKYADRISLVHLKDGISHKPCAIGDGEASCKAVYDFSVKNSVDWIIVEVSSHDENPMATVEKSIAYIKNNC
ncbi:MAG: sugar phosphate isomerase/epimerase [Oscillospiraceae bacterium]|jgi:sugar phosphate isomerase/epimerase